MASIEERIAFNKISEMSEDQIRTALKAVPNELLLAEISRRMTIKAEISDMAGVITKVLKMNVSE